MTVLIISIGRMPFRAQTVADPHLALVIAHRFYLHHIELADQVPASGRLQADIMI